MKAIASIYKYDNNEVKHYEGLIDYYLSIGELYFSHIHGKNRFTNNISHR